MDSLAAAPGWRQHDLEMSKSGQSSYSPNAEALGEVALTLAANTTLRLLNVKGCASRPNGKGKDAQLHLPLPKSGPPLDLHSSSRGWPLEG
jgi:hypothetical protein